MSNSNSRELQDVNLDMGIENIISTQYLNYCSSKEWTDPKFQHFSIIPPYPEQPTVPRTPFRLIRINNSLYIRGGSLLNPINLSDFTIAISDNNQLYSVLIKNNNAVSCNCSEFTTTSSCTHLQKAIKKL